MPRRKIERNLEKKEELLRLRRERKTESQRRQDAKAKVNNSLSKIHNQGNHIICIASSSHDNPIIKHVTPLYQNPAEYHSRYISQKKGQASLNICSESLINVVEYYIGPMDVFRVHCNARHFVAERISNKGNSFNDCCNHGAVYLEPLPEIPLYLRSLFDGSNKKSINFFKHIRSYNSLFSFASFNANLNNFQGRRPGPYCFKIQGQIYYQINTALYAAQNENTTYGQLFIVDSNEAIDHRLNENLNLDFEIVQNLEHIMREYNIFAKSYIMMGEELKKQQLVSNELLPELQLLFTLKSGMDRRRYNFQRTNEVAAVFSTTADGEIPESYVIIHNKNTKTLQKINTMDPNVEPWIYPLFYPYGTQGWHRH